MRKLLFLFFSIASASCALFPELSKRDFTYNNYNSKQSIDIAVPRGYSKSEKIVDSAGNQLQLFHYGNSVLYNGFYRDTTISFQVIDTSFHIPLPHPRGGLIYKGIDSAHLYFKEIRLYNGLRFGYKNVSQAQEGAFDSALNYSSLRSPFK
jgi:hypothetical protein